MRLQIRCEIFAIEYNLAIGLEMDVREISFDSESFDVAIDKGTMDAMMTAKADVWVCLTPMNHPSSILIRGLLTGSP